MKFFVALVVVVLVAGFIFWDDFVSRDPEDVGSTAEESAGDEVAVEVTSPEIVETTTGNEGKSYRTLMAEERWNEALAVLDAMPSNQKGTEEETATRLCLVKQGMEGNTDQALDRLMNTAPGEAPAVKAVMQSLDEANVSLLEKRKRLSRIISGFGLLNEKEVVRLTQEMKTINQALPGSIQGLLEVEKYKVVPNDCLWNISKYYKKKFGFSIESGLLCQLNGIKNDVIFPGQTLLIPKEKVEIRIFRKNWLLTVTVGDCLLAAYRVGLGMMDKTPSGEFVIQTRLENPDWYSDVHGKIIPYGDPKNVLGTRWLGFENQENARGFGIHGTTEPDSIGRNMSSGCIRMLNEDVENLFQIISRGTPVEVL
ncbi:MAG: L,D-transpeptidase family protein [Planctomycetota bacterium]